MIINTKGKTIINDKVQCILSLNISIPWTSAINQEDKLIYDKELCEAVLNKDQIVFNKRINTITKNFHNDVPGYDINFFVDFNEVSVNNLYVDYINIAKDFIFSNNGVREIILYKNSIIWNHFIVTSGE
jgi:hypothetical protein